MDDWEKFLNPAQLTAVKIEKGPILILAGAGSGKTRVITYRIAYLIRKRKIHPLNILAVTFTNKAAEEMKSRVSTLLNNEDPDIWIRTYHSTCAKILRNGADRIGISKNFSIYDEQDQLSIIKDILGELKIDTKEFSPAYILQLINRAKENLISPENYIGSPTVKTVYKLYNQYLQANNALDFDDLIFKTVELFQKDRQTLEYYQNRFQHILVDEYQDTNYAQYILTKLLAEKYRNICVVGDDDQSIYSWRGAEIRNILNFEKDYPETVVIKLEQNYRSTKTILKAASEVVKNNRYRKEKILWCNNEPGEKIEFYDAADDEKEADYVAKKIEEELIKGCKLREIAVFYRLNYQSRIFEEAFVKNKIPYEVIGALRFYERAEIKNILAYLRVIDNLNDSVSLRRIINLPSRHIGNETLEKITQYQKYEKISFFEALKNIDYITGINKKTKENIKSFIEMLQGFITLSNSTDLYALTLKIVAEAGYLDSLNTKHTDEEINRRENIEELLRSIKDFVEENPDATISEYLESVSLRSDIDDWKNTDRVSLMTLHNSKGLEFEIVFITGLEDGLLPHYKSTGDKEYEEERRLFYVGITRAKKRLYLTCSRQRKSYRGSMNPTKVSPFLKELPTDVFATVVMKSDFEL